MDPLRLTSTMPTVHKYIDLLIKESLFLICVIIMHNSLMSLLLWRELAIFFLPFLSINLNLLFMEQPSRVHIAVIIWLMDIKKHPKLIFLSCILNKLIFSFIMLKYWWYRYAYSIIQPQLCPLRPLIKIWFRLSKSKC